MGLFEQFPYTNFHELNLDWLIKKVQEAYSPDNPPEGYVLSVNGEDGNVILYKEAQVALPNIEGTQWNFYRGTGANGKILGIQFEDGQPAKIIDGENRYSIFTSDNPPPYPVTAVNGQTGNVIISVPVQSVNGQTGVITLYPEAWIRFPDTAETTWNMRREADGEISGIQFVKEQAAQRIQGTNRYNIYDEGNPPPYPVTAVNGLQGSVAIMDTSIVTDQGVQKIKIAFPVTTVDGQTGAVTTWGASSAADLEPPVAADAGSWSIRREISTGDKIGIQFEYDSVNDVYNAYLAILPDGGSLQKVKLLTPSDIPSSSGVVSINGLTGVVNLYASNMQMAANDSTLVKDAIDDNTEAIATEETRAEGVEDKLKSDLGIVEDTNTATHAIAAGQYVIWKDELYMASSAIAVGDTLSSSNLTAISSGLGSEVASLNSTIANNQLSTSNGVTVSKAGNVVTVASGQGNAINYNIPAGYRPAVIVYFPCMAVISGAWALRWGNINPNGNITITDLGGSSITPSQVAFCISYCVN